MLSDEQIIALDYKTMTQEQFDGIFFSDTYFVDEA